MDEQDGPNVTDASSILAGEANMPFRSAKQRKYMFANHPRIAKRWAKKYGTKPRPKKKRA